MPRLIQITDVASVVSPLTVAPGDLLQVAASGALIHGVTIELLGIFIEAVVGTDGLIHVPQGLPNVVVLRAVAVGGSSVEIVGASEPGQPRTEHLDIIVAFVTR
jgi:hypothetical protein